MRRIKNQEFTFFLRQFIICISLILGASLSTTANGGIGYKGLKLNLNGTNSWYNVHGVSWGYQGCGDYGSTFYNSGSSNWNTANLGTFSTTATLQITGYAVVGWTDNTDYVSGKLEYKVWKQGDVEPTSWTVINIGNYQSPTSGVTQVVCTSGNDRVVGYNNGTTSFQPGVAGTYNFKVRAFGRMQYTGGGGGSFNANDGSELTATFTISANAPTITSTSSSITSTNSQTYKGATITINGTNLSAINSVKIGGSSGVSCSSVSASSTQVTAVVPNGSSGGTIWISNGTNNATSTDSYTNLGLISTSTGNWNTSGTWLGGTTPSSGDNVTIANGTNVTLDVAASVAVLTIQSGGTFTNGTQVLTINSAGSISNNGTFTGNTGTVTFAGTGTVSGTVNFNNVNLSNGVNFGVASTINGTLNLNTGGFINTNAPNYASGSTLVYNTGGTYGRSTEWSTTSGAGYPFNVQISNNTTLNLGANAGTTTARQCAGSLTVDSGSTLSLNINAMSQALTVKGNYINNGTTVLSGSLGGDLKLEGNMNDNGVFTANGRAIFFEGSNNQTINSSTNPLDIDVMRIGKSGGEVILAQNLLVDESADPIQFTTANSVLNLNGYTAAFGKAATASAITMNASSRIKGSTTSSIEILGTGAFGTIYLDQTTPGSTNALNNFTINRTSSGSVTLANPIAVSGTLTIANGTINLGTNRHTAANLTLGSSAQTTSSSYGGTGSPAENINATYFAATSGYVNLGSCTTYSLTSTSATACLGSPAIVTLTNTTTSQLPVGTYAVLYTLSGANTGSATGTMVVSTAGTGTFTTTNITNSGATTITINFIRNGCVSAISANNSASITINSVQTASVTIASSDADNTICSGTSVTFTATPTNGGSAPSYQWKLNGSNVGSDSATYTTSSLNNGDVVSVVMTSNATPCLTGSPATSNTITTTVNANQPASVTISSSDADNTICSGTSVTFTATPTNGGSAPSYQWKLNGSNIGSDSATYTTSSLNNGDVVSVVMTSNATPCLTGSPATSNEITTTVNTNQPASVTIASSDADNTICSGTSVTFTATPTNGGSAPSYQWKLNGSNVGSDSAMYTTSSLNNGDVVSVVMTSNATPCLTGSPATSNTISTMVTTLSASISGTNGANQCPGSNVNFTLSGTANSIVSYNLNGGATQTVTLTGGTATVTVTAATTSQTLNLISVDNGACTVALSDSSTITIESTTWSGTAWSNGTPTSTKAAIISGNLTIASTFNACSITVTNNAVVTVNSGTNVQLNGSLTVNTGASFTLNSNANLIQTDPSAVNSGAIIVNRTSNPLLRLDYIMWSSPVASQNLFNFSPLTSVNPTIRFYSYNSTTNLFNSVTDYATHTMGTGKGYLIRLPWNHPTAPATWTGTFTGVPNNGTKTVTLNNGGAGQRYNLVGNPYPSTLRMDQFYSDNTNAINPTIYFWRKTNGSANPSYCTYNLETDSFVGNGQPHAVTATNNPNGIIQVGQGFIVEAKNSATSLEFNNGQRVANNANQMFRSTAESMQTLEKNRIWLTISGTNNEFAQTMVGYFTNGALDIDTTDSPYFNDGTIAFNSKINGVEYAINGRPVPFDTTDSVPMHFKVATTGTYTIAIDQKDGLFATTTQPIYLKDNDSATFHNLNDGPYTFTSVAGAFENRFELVYQNALGTNNPSLDSQAFEVIKANGKISVNANSALQTVTLFDVQGRLLTQVNASNATEIAIPYQGADQVILVQVTTSDKKTGVKKVQ